MYLRSNWRQFACEWVESCCGRREGFISPMTLQRVTWNSLEQLCWESRRLQSGLCGSRVVCFLKVLPLCCCCESTIECLRFLALVFIDILNACFIYIYHFLSLSPFFVIASKRMFALDTTVKNSRRKTLRFWSQFMRSHYIWKCVTHCGSFLR